MITRSSSQFAVNARMQRLRARHGGPLIARVRCRQRCRSSCEPLPPAFAAILCQAGHHGRVQEIVPLHSPPWTTDGIRPPRHRQSLWCHARSRREGVPRANCKPLFPFASLCAPQQTSISFFRPVPRPRRQGPHSQGVARVMNPRGYSPSSPHFAPPSSPRPVRGSTTPRRVI